MTRKEIKDFCDMKSQLEPENEDIYKEIVKMLEQEPILDRVRAEIQDIAFDWQEIDGEHESIMVVDLNDALNIIDKHKAESNIEKRKPCINSSDGCEEWAGCPCVYYKAENEVDNGNDN